MRAIPVSVCLAGLVALVGCATRPPVVVHDSVGPHRTRRRTEGELVVYSATYVSTGEQSEYPVHTDFTLCDENGRSPRTVANRSGPYAADPAVVHLPPGHYQVTALMAGGGYVTAPVVIEIGRQTVLDLDGSSLPRDLASNDDLVRLPDGHVIGWRAEVK